MLVEILRRYKSYDPSTGEFTATRSLREYGRVIGVSDTQLSQIFNGHRRPGMSVLERLAQTFTEAGKEIGAAFAANAEREPAEATQGKEPVAS